MEATFFAGVFFATAFFLAGDFLEAAFFDATFLLAGDFLEAAFFFAGTFFELVFFVAMFHLFRLRTSNVSKFEGCVCIIHYRLCQCTYLSDSTGIRITRNICPFKGRSSTDSGTSIATLLNASVSLSIYARCTSTAAFTASSE